jgi:mycothiol synthase
MSLSELSEKIGAEYSVRRPTSDDLQNIHALISAYEISLLGVAETTENDLRLDLSAPGFDLTTASWLVSSHTGQVVGFAAIEVVDHARMFTSTYVHPDHQGRGIGTHLLYDLEQWAQQQIPLAAPDVRISLCAFGVEQNDTAKNLLLKHGFQISRRFWRMGIDLSSVPPVPQWPEGIVVCTVTPDLFHAVYEADQSIFQDHWGFMPQAFDDWMYRSIKRENFDATLWFLAMNGNDIVGIAICADEKELGGWVHVLGVSRTWRRKGLASALLQYAFHEFAVRAISQIFLGVDAQSLTGATYLYEHAGMHVVRERFHYEKELRAGKELSTQSLQK